MHMSRHRTPSAASEDTDSKRNRYQSVTQPRGDARTHRNTIYRNVERVVTARGIHHQRRRCVTVSSLVTGLHVSITRFTSVVTRVVAVVT